MTQPLELKLNERYDYKLLGTEQVNGTLCFVVGVEPKVQDEALYSGKIWIDGTTFREVKQSLSQRGVKEQRAGKCRDTELRVGPRRQGKSIQLAAIDFRTAVAERCRA